MTILHLVRSFGGKRIGGAEKNIFNLINLIESSSYEKNIIVSDKGLWKYNKKENTFKNIKFISHKLFIIFKNNKHNIKNIHVHSNGYFIFLGYILAFLLKSKLIIKITRIGEGSLINRKKEVNLKYKLILKRNLFRFICKSNFVYLHILSESCMEIINNLTKNVIIFPNLIKSGHYDENFKKANSFIISSRMIKRKNIDLAIDNLLSLNNKENTLLLIGDGPELKRLKRKYRIHKSQIKFKGYLDNKEIVNFYKRSEYFINFSDSEGMSNSLIEAMSYGCKCIVSNIPENIHTAKNYAIYYEKGDDFHLKIKETSKLEPKVISDYANSKYSIDFFSPNRLMELYKIDNSNFSSRQRQ